MTMVNLSAAASLKLTCEFLTLSLSVFQNIRRTMVSMRDMTVPTRQSLFVSHGKDFLDAFTTNIEERGTIADQNFLGSSRHCSWLEYEQVSHSFFHAVPLHIDAFLSVLPFYEDTAQSKLPSLSPLKSRLPVDNVTPQLSAPDPQVSTQPKES
jgi:hypothetical protein